MRKNKVRYEETSLYQRKISSGSMPRYVQRRFDYLQCIFHFLTYDRPSPGKRISIDRDLTTLQMPQLGLALSDNIRDLA